MKKKTVVKIISRAAALALMISLGWILVSKTFEIRVIRAESMEPSFLDGDRILLIRVFEDIERYDILLVQDPWRPEPVYIKRCIGLPGEQLEIKKKIVFINGHRLENDPGVFKDPQLYVGENVPLRFSKRDTLGPFRIPREHFFVMGDNRDFSTDSRYFGMVPRTRVRGKAWMVVLPLMRMKFL